MIVKRKLFSFIDEDGNLGYYLYNESTGEEKLFSVVEEEREFAEKEEKKERKLKPLHRYNIAMYKLEGKRGRKLEKQNLEGDWKGTAKSSAKAAAGITGLGILGGAAIGKNKKAALVGAGLGALIGTSTGIGSTLGTATVGKLRKIDPKYNKLAEQRLDEIKVAEGEMTREEYMDKWYKED